jgi:TRAP-type mannitol/chloroaromatic compound transport system permease small subunit
VSGRRSPRTRLWIDVAGTLFFLLPFSLIVVYYGWPIFVDSFAGQERSETYEEEAAVNSVFRRIYEP